MLHTLLDNLVFFILFIGISMLLYFIIGTAIRKERTRAKRMQLLERVQRLKKKYDQTELQ